MAIRLFEMKRIFKKTGSIYLHCDPTASHYLKLVMDSLFGKKSFRNEITWKRHTSVFTTTRPAMKGVDWGSLHNDFKDADLDPDAIDRETACLVLDDDVTSHAGIYPYILTREEKHLNIRTRWRKDG